ncbi:hypothetical protein MAR_010087, partial [Mya arenaria]
MVCEGTMSLKTKKHLTFNLDNIRKDVDSEEEGDGPRRHNGIDDLDQNSFEMRESRDPTFEVDHLATYTSKS